MCFNNIFNNCNFWVILIAMLIILSICDGEGNTGRGGCGCG